MRSPKEQHAHWSGTGEAIRLQMTFGLQKGESKEKW
jgi:hypothetical protein